MSEKSATLYRLWNASHALLYVGVTADVDRRMEQHAADKPWWGEVDQVTTELLPSMRRALEAEARAIFWEQPRHNVLGSPRYSADWEAKCHALEDAEASRLARPYLEAADFDFLADIIRWIAANGREPDARRLYDLLVLIDKRAMPA